MWHECTQTEICTLQLVWAQGGYMQIIPNELCGSLNKTRSRFKTNREIGSSSSRMHAYRLVNRQLILSHTYFRTGIWVRVTNIRMCLYRIIRGRWQSEFPRKKYVSKARSEILIKFYQSAFYKLVNSKVRLSIFSIQTKIELQRFYLDMKSIITVVLPLLLLYI